MTVITLGSLVVSTLAYDMATKAASPLPKKAPGDLKPLLLAKAAIRKRHVRKLSPIDFDTPVNGSRDDSHHHAGGACSLWVIADEIHEGRMAEQTVHEPRPVCGAAR